MTTFRNNMRAAAGLFIASLAVATPAAAQEAGTYNGTMKNGDTFQLTVTKATSGALEVTAGLFDFSVAIKCKSNSTTVGPVGGFTLSPPVVIADNKATISFNNGADDYVATKIEFSGSKASGDVTAAFAAFAAYTGHPTKAVYCPQVKEDFTAVLAKAVRGAAVPVPKLLFY